MANTLRIADPVIGGLGSSDTGDIQYRVRLDIGTTDGRMLVSEEPDGAVDLYLRGTGAAR